MRTNRERRIIGRPKLSESFEDLKIQQAKPSTMQITETVFTVLDADKQTMRKNTIGKRNVAVFDVFDSAGKAGRLFAIKYTPELFVGKIRMD